MREQYEQKVAEARGVYVFFVTQKRAIPLIAKAKNVVRVEGCSDRNETILRLGFLAAEQSFNALVQVEVTSEKVRNAGYQTSAWKGVGLPAKVDPLKIDREYARDQLFE